MTPVEHTRTCCIGMASVLAVASAMARAAIMPGSPVQALAFPELTIMACTAPRLSSRCRWETTTGAALTALVVNTDAPQQGRVE